MYEIKLTSTPRKERFRPHFVCGWANSTRDQLQRWAPFSLGPALRSVRDRKRQSEMWGLAGLGVQLHTILHRTSTTVSLASGCSLEPGALSYLCSCMISTVSPIRCDRYMCCVCMSVQFGKVNLGNRSVNSTISGFAEAATYLWATESGDIERWFRNIMGLMLDSKLYMDDALMHMCTAANAYWISDG